MERVKWVAGAVLATVLLGVAAVEGAPWGEAAVGEEHAMTIPPAAFTPMSDALDYTNHGYRLTSTSGTHHGYTAPVVFPVDLDHVRIKSVTLRAYDEGPEGVCMDLNRIEPKSGGYTYVTTVCSFGTMPSVRSFSERAFRPRSGRPNTSFVLTLILPGDASKYRFHGAMIVWEEI